jgi:hypothetical protein
MTAASFQSTVYAKPAFGVVGEIFDNGPVKCQPYTIDSASAAYNVFGRAFSITSEGLAEAGNASGTKQFAGILVNPKTNPLYGDGTNQLNPSLLAPEQSVCQLLTMGSIVVAFATTAAIGNVVVFDNTTGVLETIAPGADLPEGKSPAYAFVDRYTVAAVNGVYLAVITVNKFPATPVAAEA